MSDAWIKIFKDFIADYEAIERLSKDGILTDSSISYKLKLLEDIIGTMRSEVE